jgi:hypothetical protein
MRPTFPPRKYAADFADQFAAQKIEGMAAHPLQKELQKSSFFA